MSLIASYKMRAHDEPAYVDVILEVHEDPDDGRCILVQYRGSCGSRGAQYMTAPIRAGAESRFGGYCYGPTPWKVHARKISRKYALSLLGQARKEDLELSEALWGIGKGDQ